jgi:predicted aspartyl protease
MGKVIVKIRAQNWDDLALIATGASSRPPRVVETEALVDTGSTGFYLKASLIRRLGLRQIGERIAITMSDRRETRRIFSPVDLEIQGRNTQFQVTELPDSLPNKVGQIPLEAMDWAIDMAGQKLIGNPEHGGELLHEEYGQWADSQ